MSSTGVSKFEVGDVVELTGSAWTGEHADCCVRAEGNLVVIVEIDGDGDAMFVDENNNEWFVMGHGSDSGTLVHRAGSVEAAEKWLEKKRAGDNVVRCPWDDATLRRKALMEAADLIDSDRNAIYGEPEDNFRRIADLFSGYLETEITPSQVAILMALVKVARLVHTPDHHDSYIDAAGYFAIGAELAASD